MKRNWKNNWALLILTFLLVLSSCRQGDQHEAHDTFTCPMHPTVLSDKPSACPVCGMGLVRKARHGEEVTITEDLARLIKSPNEVIVTNIGTIKPQYKSVAVSIDIQGVVTYDTKNIYTISSRVSGRMDKVHLKYSFQEVRQGQKIAEIYSAELITAQRELLFVIDSDPGNNALIESSKRKLQLFGFSQAQMNSLIDKKEIRDRHVIYSPYSGYLITDQRAPSTTVSTSPAAMDNEMSQSPSPSVTAEISAGNLVREGTYVNAGQSLFRIVNNAALRIELDLPAKQSGAIRKGDRLALDLGNGHTEKSTVDFVQPFLNGDETFEKLRVFVKNVKGLHIGHLVNAQITVPSTESLWISRNAVLDIGEFSIVFIKDRGVFKPKKVTTGTHSADLIEITGGLSSSDDIASDAHYLVDSESFIKASN